MRGDGAERADRFARVRGVNVVIVGCSRLGARLAGVLSKRGHHVTIIDTNSAAFGRLPEFFHGETVIGTGIDEDILIEAGIEHADMFVAATNGDNRNIMSSQLAKNMFGVEKVLCRIYDPVRAEAYGKLGLTTICPTVTVANLFLTAVELDPITVG
jgi:trk system potassium uptake protein TrkA